MAIYLGCTGLQADLATDQRHQKSQISKMHTKTLSFGFCQIEDRHCYVFLNPLLSETCIYQIGGRDRALCLGEKPDDCECE